MIADTMTRAMQSYDLDAIDCTWDEVGDWFEYWTFTADHGLTLALTVARLEPQKGQDFWCGWIEPICPLCGLWGNLHHVNPACEWSVTARGFATLGATQPRQVPGTQLETITGWLDELGLDPDAMYLDAIQDTIGGWDYGHSKWPDGSVTGPFE